MQTYGIRIGYLLFHSESCLTNSTFLQAFIVSFVLFVDAVTAKFGPGHWQEARGAINQYGLDCKRRKFSKTGETAEVPALDSQ